MANPFSQAKDLYKLQSEAKKLQKEMESKIFKGESKKSLVKVSVNGTGEIVDLDVDDILFDKDRKSDFIEHIKEAYKDAQKKIAKDMSKDMDLSKLKNMMGV
jgi:DNA-binding YbaB/EbfC family protein